MKKILAVLVFSAVCVAILFAQEAVNSPQKSAPAVPVLDAPESIEDTVSEEIIIVEEETVPDAASVDVPVAQEPEEPAAEEDVVETDEIGITDDLSAGAEISGGLISLSLKDVEMQDVVRLFSRLSNANIIVPDMMDKENPKRIDVNLDNVEWKPALQAILDTHGLELIEKIPGSEVYSIRERPADAPEPVEIKVFKLDYATVGEVLTMVDTLVKKDGGQISTYPARNSIVVQGTAKLINDLDRIVAAVDLPREQVFIEAKFLELSDSASEQLGIDWNVLGGYRAGVGGISGDYSFNKSQTDNVNKFRDISGLPYEQLDSEPSEVTWVKDESDADPYAYDLINGIDYDARPIGGVDSALTRIFGLTPTTEALDSTVVGKTMAATLTADDFTLVLSALKTMNGAKVVSNPKIIVANEETATIHIGRKIPNVKGTIQTAGDNQVNRVYALDDTEPYFEDGVKVDVTPTVNTKENITVRIQPTLDRLQDKSEVEPAPDGTYFYGKRTKTINTVFGLQSGQTAAIGGLTEVSKSNVDRKVPLLGEIPYLGRLFSYKSTNNEQVETIIFVTVGLANPESMEFEVGLPEDSKLAMRYRTEAQVDRTINKEELSILKNMEADRLQDRLESLRATEKQRVEDRVLEEQKELEKKQAAEQKLLAKQQAAEQRKIAAEQKLLAEQADEEPPIAEEPASDVEKQTSEAVEEVMPAVDQPAAAVAVEEPAPAVEEPAPAVEEVLPAITEDAMPIAEDPAPVAESAKPVEEAIPVVTEEAPVVVEEPAPTVDKQSSVGEIMDELEESAE